MAAAKDTVYKHRHWCPRRGGVYATFARATVGPSTGPTTADPTPPIRLLQGIAEGTRRYSAASLRRCLEEAELEVLDLLWWGQWMVRPLRARKSHRRRRAGDTSVDVYRRYLSLPPWPAPWMMRALFHVDRRRTLRHRNATGTSLIAVAARPSA